MAVTGHALSDAEVDRLLSPLVGRSLFLAVSGGPDSVALLGLVAKWAVRHGGAQPIALTVDHGLRSASRSEAEGVVAWAKTLNLDANVLTWPGKKPQSDLAAQARIARYDLMAAAVASFRRANPVLLTAHTADDAAETMIMRLARGSGLDGLAGPRNPMVWRGWLPVARPLLPVAKDRLIATCNAHGWPFVDDPTNRDPQHERARVRAALPTLAPLGVTTASLARSAARLARARTTLTDLATASAQTRISANRGLFGTLELAITDRPASEIDITLMRWLIEAFGGAADRVSLQHVEALADDIAGTRAPIVRTLGGTRVAYNPHRSQLRVEREWQRRPLPESALVCGVPTVWDRRFHLVTNMPGLTVRGIVPDDWPLIVARWPEASALPRRAAGGLPIVLERGRLHALPYLGAGDPPREQPVLQEFLTPWAAPSGTG